MFSVNSPSPKALVTNVTENGYLRFVLLALLVLTLAVKTVDVSPKVPLAGEAGLAQAAVVHRAIVLLDMDLKVRLLLKHEPTILTHHLVDYFDFVCGYFSQWRHFFRIALKLLNCRYFTLKCLRRDGLLTNIFAIIINLFCLSVQKLIA